MARAEGAPSDEQGVLQFARAPARTQSTMQCDAAAGPTRAIDGAVVRKLHARHPAQSSQRTS